MFNLFRFQRFFQAAGRFSLPQILSFVFHLPNFCRLFSRLLKDPRVPFHLKFLCYFSIFYLISPLDLIRDLPFFQIGYIDDAFLLIFSFRKLMKDSPPEVVREHVQAIADGRKIEQ